MTQLELLDVIRDALAKIAETVRRALSSVAANVGQVKHERGTFLYASFLANPQSDSLDLGVLVTDDHLEADLVEGGSGQIISMLHPIRWNGDAELGTRAVSELYNYLTLQIRELLARLESVPGA